MEYNRKIIEMLKYIMDKAERTIALESNTPDELQDKIEKFDYKCKKIFEYIDSLENDLKNFKNKSMI